MKQPKIALIILNYNQEEKTAQCLERVGHLLYPAFETVVVDNGSRRNSEETLKTQFPKVSWIRLRENIGFAAGCNEGIRWALARGTEAVVLLNNDAKVLPDLLEKMAESAYSDAEAGIVGAVMYREDSAHPFFAGMQFDFFSARIRRIPPSKERRVPVVSGSCFFIKKECLEKTGFLDERFFLYFEETDFCYRARQQGFQVLCDPRIRVQHQDGSTFGRESPALKYLYTRNRLLFLSKHAPLWIRPWTFLVRIIQDGIRASFFLFKGQGQMSQAIFYGVSDYCQGRFGKGRLDHFFHG